MVKKKHEQEWNMLFLMDHIVRLPNEDLDNWCERYELNTFIGKCSKCNQDVNVCVPFASGNFRGLVSEDCSCGNKQLPCCYVNINPKHVLNTHVFGINK